MRKIMLALAFAVAFALGFGGYSYSETMLIEELVDSFNQATDLQKEEILKDNLGKEITASGKVSNVGAYDLFDTGSDLKGTYYQVSAETQKTKNNGVYQLIFLFKDKDKLKDINKGQDIQDNGKIVRIIDERLQISVWLFCGELSENDKILLKQN